MTMSSDDRPMAPTLLTLDVFGTVVDWLAGLRADLAPHGMALGEADFEQVIAAQGADEAGTFRTYREITAASLVRVLGLRPADADAVGRNVGRWPLFPDSREALRRLSCVAMTNSDRAHGDQVQRQLGFPLSDWVCAEEVRVYKPNPAFWHAVAGRLGVTPGRHWWHVSAHPDYDLEIAGRLGLTRVFVARPHAHPGQADHQVADLAQLADLVEQALTAPG
jgi:2-haloalkanoic acid dehalogenase type II